MKIDVLCSDAAHPVNAWLERWARENGSRANIRILRSRDELEAGDLLFLISCHQIIRQRDRGLFRHVLVVHASDLPKGRGWSPLIWAITSGADRVTVSLLEAAEAVDSGDVWAQREIGFDGTELYDEINEKLFRAEVELMDWALDNIDRIAPRKQEGEPTYLPKRTPEDGRIDPTRSIADSFDLLRVADPDRYPAFFEHRGQKYRVRIEKMEA